MYEDLKKDFYSFLYIGDILSQKEVVTELETFLCCQKGKIYHIDNDAEARAIVENYKVSAIIIDQYLPNCSGLDFMRWLNSFANIPTVLILSDSSASETETIVALEAGAADAVPADISPRELAARVRACIRKYFHGPHDMTWSSDEHSFSTPFTRRHPLYFNPVSKRLYFSDTSRKVLHGKEAELLEFLILKYPQYISREEISQQIFQASWNPNDRRIDNLISRLRKIIDTSDDDNNNSAIETVRNEGYRLRSPISAIHTDDSVRLDLSIPGKSRTLF